MATSASIASQRLRDGIERDLSLVIGKSVIAMLDDGGDAREPFRIGLEFGTHYRRDGWGAGLTTLTCLMNLLPRLRAEDRARAMFHGLCSVANDSDGHPPRFEMRPLPGGGSEPSRRSSDGCGDSSRFATAKAPSDASSQRCAPARRRARSPT